MTRVLHESIAGVNLLIPDAYDFFDIEAGGMPNGDDCLLINPDALASGADPRAFVQAPTLSPNIFKAAGAGPFTCTFWAAVSAAANTSPLVLGVQNALASGGSANANNPMRIQVGTGSSIGLGACTMSVMGTSAQTWTAGGFISADIWRFHAFAFGATGNPGFAFSCAENEVPATSVNTTANRTASTPWGSDLYFYIGRYSDGASAVSLPSRTMKFGKLSFHDEILDITDLHALFYAMVGV